MIFWETVFDAGDVAWMLLVSVITPVLCCYGYWCLFPKSSSEERQQQFLEQLPLLLSVLILAWCGGIYSLAFAPSVGTLPEAPESAPAPMGSLQEAMEVEDAKVDQTQQFGRGGIWGGLDYLALNRVVPEGGSHEPAFPMRRPQYHLPHLVVCLFQFSSYLVVLFPVVLVLKESLSGIRLALFLLVWSILVYVPVAHAVAGDGWLEHLGTLDSANGLLLLASGCALLILGRRDKPVDAELPSLSQTAGMVSILLGMVFLQAGHVFQADGRAAMVMLNALLGGAAGMLSWSFCTSFLWCRQHTHHLAPSLLAATAATAACGGVVLPQSATIVGVTAGVLGNLLDHWAQCEGRIARTFGMALCSGATVGLLGGAVFATTGAGGLRWDGREISGLLQGNTSQFQHQLIAIIAVGLWSLLVTGLLQFVCRAVCGLRSVDVLTDEVHPVAGLENEADREPQAGSSTAKT